MLKDLGRMGIGLSNRIKIGALIATFLVVIRHSLNLHNFYGEIMMPPLALSFIENFISRLSSIAVPFFFLVSGFFFFSNNYYQRNIYVRMIKKKVHTLLIPFLIWNICGVIWLLVYNSELIGDSWSDCLYGLLSSRWYGALWYVRNLMIMMVLAPLYQWTIMEAKPSFPECFRKVLKVVNCLMIVFLFYVWIPIDCTPLSTEGWFFFVLGGVFSSKLHLLDRVVNVYFICCLVAIWLFLCSLDYWSPLYFKVTTLIGIVAFWGLLQMTHSRFDGLLIKMAPMSFFIYVNHFYIVKALKILTATFFPANAYIAFFSLIVYPCLCFYFLYIGGQFWKKKAPQSFFVVTGGRG